MLSVSVIDYIGKIKDGVAVLLSMNVDDKIYELVFWFNKTSNYTLTVDEKLLTDLKLESIYEYPHTDKLVDIIFDSLPPIEKLFEKYYI
jgi:predicted GTPase